MASTWISKSTRAQIRMRRKKKKTAADGSNTNGATDNDITNIQKKRKRSDEEEINKSTSQVKKVVVPSNLTSKQAKKFRKDARRKIRVDGLDEQSIQFVNEEGVPFDNTDSTSSTSNTNTNTNDGTSNQTETTKSNSKKKPKKKFPRINDLLAQAEKQKQLEDEKQRRLEKEQAIPLEEKEKYVAIDCEMVGIGTDGKQSALARVSITKWDGTVVLDTFVQVPTKVTDFRTWVSGVRPKDISSSQNSDAMELQACLKRVGEIMKDKIVVGHSLKSDFEALMMNHPKKMVRDTATFKPLMRPSGRNGGKMRPRKLKDLAKEYADLSIQVDGEAHSSVDDARATMEVYKVVRDEWEKEIDLADKKKQKQKK